MAPEKKEMGEQMTRIFLHGLDSSSKGKKAQYFRRNFVGMLTPDFTGDLHRRLTQLREILHDTGNLILVGSSFGGLMAAVYALEHPDRVNKLILLAPALNFPDFSVWQGRTSPTPTSLFIGKHDTVTPPGPVVQAAEATFTNLTVNLLDDDHMLGICFPQMDWPSLLSTAT